MNSIRLQLPIRHPMRLITASAILLLSACSSKDAGQHGDQGSSPVVSLPRLERVGFSPASDGQPFTRVPIKIDSAGGIYYYGESAGDGFITHLDSSGALVSRFGPSGSGPGELSGSGVLLATGDTIVVYDTHQVRAVYLSTGGSLLNAFQLESLLFPLQVRGTTLYAFDPTTLARGKSPTVVAIELGAAGMPERTVVDTSERLFRALLTDLDPQRPVPIPAFWIGTDIRLIGNPATGRIVILDSAGRREAQIPGGPPTRGSESLARLRESLSRQSHGPTGELLPINKANQARLDTLDRERLPYFAWPGLWADSGGHVWAVGAGGDATLVDVFADTTWLGRLALPCRQPGKMITHNGRWLALECQISGDADVPFEIQLYRVVWPDSGSS